MKKYLAVSAIFLLAGCNDDIDCNSKDISDYASDTYATALFNKLSSIREPNSSSMLKINGAVIDVSSKKIENNDKNTQTCDFTFKIHPAISEAVEFINEKPIRFTFSKGDKEVSIANENEIEKQINDLVNNNAFQVQSSAPTKKQEELIENHKKIAEEKERENKKLKEEQDRIANEKKIQLEAENKKLEQKRIVDLQKIKSLSQSDYKLTTVSDIVFFFTARDNHEYTDEEYLHYFSPAYSRESDIFKKDEMKNSELERVKSEINRMKSTDYLAIVYPISDSGYANSDYFDMHIGKRPSYVRNSLDSAPYLLKGFNVSDNSIDLSKTQFSKYCQNKNEEPSEPLVVASPGNVNLYVDNNNKLSSCIIKFKDREEARKVYEQLSRSRAGNNSKNIALILDLYVDGSIEKDGLRTYITNIELGLKDYQKNESIYSANDKE